MVIIPKEIHKKWDKEIRKTPPELIKRIAETIHKHY